MCINRLMLWGNPSIPNSEPNQVDFEIRNLVHVVDPLANGRHPLSRVGFSEGIKRVPSILGEEGEELDEELIQVVRHLGLGARKALRVGKAVACPDRVVDVDHVGFAVPGVRVEPADGRAVFGAVLKDGADWPVDLKEPEQRRRAGPSLQPYHDRSFCCCDLL